MALHEEQKVFQKGSDIKNTDKAVIMLHGRGGTAQGILRLSEQLPEAAYLAPQAADRTWYPKSFLRPREENRPHLDSALEKLDMVIEQASQHLPLEKIVLLGFSQGACLASEYAARNPERYGGLIVFSGGLIGEEIKEFSGDMGRTPVFLGCSENDPHIPLERVEETEKAFRGLNADIKKEIYPGSSHEINQDELESAAKIIRGV